MLKKVIIIRIICLIFSAAVLAAGVIKKEYLLITMGCVAALSCAINFMHFRNIVKDPEKKRAYENAMHDERLIYISNKSYSLAFNVSVYAMFFGAIAAIAAGYREYGILICYIICGMLIIHGIARRIYSKKY